MDLIKKIIVFTHFFFQNNKSKNTIKLESQTKNGSKIKINTQKFDKLLEIVYIIRFNEIDTASPPYNTGTISIAYNNIRNRSNNPHKTCKRYKYDLMNNLSYFYA